MTDNSNITNNNNDIERINYKIDEILELLNCMRIDLNVQHHDLYGNGKKGLISRVEVLEDVSQKHSKYFWLISLICTASAGLAEFFINKLYK